MYQVVEVVTTNRNCSKTSQWERSLIKEQVTVSQKINKWI